MIYRGGMAMNLSDARKRQGIKLRKIARATGVEVTHVSDRLRAPWKAPVLWFCRVAQMLSIPQDTALLEWARSKAYREREKSV